MPLSVFGVNISPTQKLPISAGDTLKVRNTCSLAQVARFVHVENPTKTLPLRIMPFLTSNICPESTRPTVLP